MGENALIGRFNVQADCMERIQGLTGLKATPDYRRRLVADAS